MSQLFEHKAEEHAWPAPKSQPEKVDDALLDRWQKATDKVSHFAAQNGWSKSEVARRADMPMGTFSAWYDGTYNGRYDKTTDKIEGFLEQLAEAAQAAIGIPEDPGFVQTLLARKLLEGFAYAQSLPTISVMTVASGLGKTQAARQYQRTRPHVYRVELSPTSSSPHQLKTEIAGQLGMDDRNPNHLKKVIVNALSRDGFSALLIVDEAQNLSEQGINELRHFRDVCNCGIVLLGNDEVSTPYASRDIKHASPQVTRRIGHRFNQLSAYPEDIETIMTAWGLEDEDVRKVGRIIANRPGAYGALVETIKAAAMIAKGFGRSITAADLRAAYELRGQGSV